MQSKTTQISHPKFTILSVFNSPGQHHKEVLTLPTNHSEDNLSDTMFYPELYDFYHHYFHTRTQYQISTKLRRQISKKRIKNDSEWRGLETGPCEQPFNDNNMKN